MKVKVYAKLNLSLNVVGAKDGFHLLDALTASINLFDVVQVSLRNDGQINVTGVDIPKQTNVAYKAAQSFFEVFGGSGCDVKIDKGIPFSQGLGGSSADASATIYCLACALGIALDDKRIKQVCDSVGSDVYFMLQGGFGKIVGRSDVEMLPPVHLHGCLTTFAHKSDTASVFNQYDIAPSTMRTDNDSLAEKLANGKIHQANELCFNALQQANQALCDYARPFVDYCKKLGLKAVMTGSGSAYFVLCPTKQRAEELVGIFQKQGFDSQVFCTVPRGIEQI
jgi:4-diphosphocytidyl-2-C-methyl-D-erythritol kinase